MFFFLGVLCLVHLTIANHHSHSNCKIFSWWFTSCRRRRRDVSPCCHLKVTTRTLDCEGKAENVSRGPNGLSLGPESVAEPTVFGDMAEQGYSSWWVRTDIALPSSSSGYLPLAAAANKSASYMTLKQLIYMVDNLQTHLAFHDEVFWCIYHSLESKNVTQTVFSPLQFW